MPGDSSLEGITVISTMARNFRRRECIPGVSNNSDSKKTDAAGIPIKNYDLPGAKHFPSDPASGTLKLTNLPPTIMPNVLSRGFDPEQPKRY